MKHFPRNMTSTCLMLMIGSASYGSGPVTALHLQATAPAEVSRFHPTEWAAVSEEYLDKLRGGFDAGLGLTVSFGIVRTVTINGVLVTKFSFNLPDVTKITADVARTVSSALAAAGIVQNGAGNRVDTGAQTQPPASVAIAPSITPGAVQSSTGKLPETSTQLQTPASIDSPSSNTVPGVVQSGAVNPANAAIQAQYAVSTVIQNSLNDQAIQSLTVINTSVNSMGLFKAINTQTVLKDALLGSLGVR